MPDRIKKVKKESDDAKIGRIIRKSNIVSKVDRANVMKEITDGVKDIITVNDKEELIFIPTRIASFNRAMVVGGAPVGCFWELHGPNGGGKTAMGVDILASAQEQGHATAFCDAERASNDKVWLKALGLDFDNCLYFNPKHFEDAATRINKMINNFREKQKKGKIPKDMCFFILVDSVAKLVPKDELEGEVGKRNYGLLANLLSGWLRTLTTLVGDTNEEKSRVAVIFINQERVNIGAQQWEPKFKSFGGEALQYDASVRVRIWRQSYIKEEVTNSEGEKIGEKKTGKVHAFHVEKNKTGYPETDGCFYTSNGEGESDLGFDRVREVVDEGINQNVIGNPVKGTYTYQGKDFKGEKKIRKFFRDNEKAFKSLVEELNTWF